MPKSNITNKYVIPSLPNTDSRVTRVLQDMADRVNFLTDEIDRVRGIANDVTGLAKSQNPVQGVLSLPGNDQDGFIRVSKDGVIQSYASPSRIDGYSIPILLSPNDSSTSSGVETVLKGAMIPGNSIQPTDTFAYDVYGFFTGSPLTTVTFRVRFLNNGTNTIITDFSFATGATVIFFYCRGIISAVDMTQVSIGSVVLGNGAVFNNRGEIVGLDLSQPSSIQFNASVTGVGPDTPIANIEGAYVIKHRINQKG